MIWRSYTDQDLIHCDLGGLNLISVPFVLSTFVKF